MQWLLVKEFFPKAKIYHEPGSRITYWTVIDSDGTYYRVVTGTDKVTYIEKPLLLK
jgi:hypothetical protein